MNARNAMSILLLGAAGLAAGAGPARGGPWLPAPGEYATQLRSGLFSADTYHDSRSHRATLARGGVDEHRSLTSISEIGWKKNASVIFALPALSVTRRSGDGRIDFTETGLSELQVGLRLKMADGPSAAAVELSWFAPTGYNRRFLLTAAEIARADTTICRGLTGADSANCVRQTAPARLGVGQQELVAAIHWGRTLPALNGFLQLSHGYRHRGREVAGQALLSADLGFWLGSSVLVAGRYLGAIDVGNAPNAADEVEEHLAGPVLIYRVDERVDVFAASLHTAIARNALHADRFFVGVTFKETGLNRLQGYLGGTKRP